MEGKLFMMEKLLFDEKTHKYTLDGKLIPSVTQVMKYASNIVYGDVNENILKMASDKGSAVHFAIELYNDTNYIEIEDNYKGYMNAYIKFIEDYKQNFSIIESECKTFHNSLHYAGTIDMVAKLNDAKIIVDIKTTSKLIPCMVSIQASAYKEAYNSQSEDKATDIYILHLSKDGEYEFIKVEEAFDVFVKLLDVYNYISNNLK